MSDLYRSQGTIMYPQAGLQFNFQFSPTAIEKFENESRISFDEFERTLNFQSFIFQFRKKYIDESGAPVFGVNLFKEYREGEVPVQSWQVKFDRTEKGFFVIAIERPMDIRIIDDYVWVDRAECAITKHLGRVTESRDWNAVKVEILQLPLAPKASRRIVSEEIEIWNTYLKVLEKIVRQKTILFPIQNASPTKAKQWGKKRANRVEYLLDLTGLQSEAVEHLSDLFISNRPKVNEVLSNEKIQFEIMRADPLDAELVDQIAEAEKEGDLRHYVWDKQEQYGFYGNFTLKYTDAKSRNAILGAIATEMNAEGIECVRNGSIFRFTDWRAVQTLQQKAKSEQVAWTMASQIDCQWRVQLKWNLPNLWAVEKAAILEDLRAAYALSVVADPSSEAIEVRKIGSQPVQSEKLGARYDLHSITVLPQCAPLPEEVEKEKANWPAAQFSFTAKNLPLALKEWQKWEKQFASGSLGELKDAQFIWRFEPLHQFEGWQREARESLVADLKKMENAQIDWPVLKISCGSQSQWEKLNRSLANKYPDWQINWDQGRVGVHFGAEDAAWQREAIAKLKNGLVQAIPKLRIKEEKGEKGEKTGGVSLACSILQKNPAIVQNLASAMEALAGDDWTVEFAHPEGFTQLIFNFDQEGHEKELNERWKDLRNSEIKLLSAKDKEEYEKEVRGKEGTFKGGLKLGRLVGLRDGKITVELSEEWGAKAAPVGAYLLPTFGADLAQVSRLKYAIEIVKRPKNGLPKNPRLSQFIFDPTLATPISIPENVTSDQYWQLAFDLNQASLNEKQKEAVWKALHGQDLMLVQGPPGTGKTTVIAEIIWQTLQENPDSKILLTSQSHLAVDNALERLYKKNLIRPLRVAASKFARKAIEPEGLKYFDDRIQLWANAIKGSEEEAENEPNAVGEWMNRVQEAVLPTGEFEKPLKKWKGLLARPEPGIKGFFRDLYMSNVNIVAATCLECGRKDFMDQFPDGFDLVIVDEASKATPPELLVPLILGRKIIIIGDHKQLPPMVEEKKIEEMLEEFGEKDLKQKLEDIKTSQFEKLFEGVDDSVKVTLTTQYRMHDQIMQIVNPFYKDEGGLKCGIEQTMDLPDLKHKGSRWHGLKLGNFLTPENHVLWVDVQTSETNHSPSYSNDGEVEAIRKILAHLQNAPTFQAWQNAMEREEDREIGIITFYAKQAEKLREVKEGCNIPIRLRTVDKFQGMERNIIIVSTVRSSEQVREGKQQGITPRKNKDIGFAKDFRRINVAFSRARQLLIIVGNEGHFSDSNPIYQGLKELIGRMQGRVSHHSL